MRSICRAALRFSAIRLGTQCGRGSYGNSDTDACLVRQRDKLWEKAMRQQIMRVVVLGLIAFLASGPVGVAVAQIDQLPSWADSTKLPKAASFN
jgi:hypothetical protein